MTELQNLNFVSSNQINIYTYLYKMLFTFYIHY